MKDLAKQYDPAQVEDRIYSYWEQGGWFTPVRDPDKKPYTIMMPPPNITGRLHMGHAMDATLQDILARFKRMEGYSTLWLPGTDHAAIATEAKIVAAMRAEGISKADLGREKFMERAWAWKDEYGGAILSQLRKMGASCDWSRLAFTMDEERSRAVNEVFVRLYNEGLIYRGERIINWCPGCKTSISDAEVEYTEKEGHLWEITYPLTDGTGSITVATTRPETMLGDAAVAVHPEDERYTALVGKMAHLPLTDRDIPIIADEYVEREFGTGAVKITPAHDPNDFTVGERHGLPILRVLDDDARMTADCGKYAGMDRYAARKAIIADLEAGGYLTGIKDHMHNVGECYRCGSEVEPMVSLQWFVKMDTLAAPAIEAVRDGRVKFVPERFDKIYFNWMENIKDWCISRQLWWGHRIPAYYCDDCGEMTVAATAPDKCPKCGGPLHQDEDSLDTWFSSALWPFATLGWPDNTEDLRYFYPTSTLVTGYDIIFFWVARMIFSGLHNTGKVPFDTVYIHGLVRDAQGRKMSKSLGNGIDPLEVIEKFGTDALRFTLVTGLAPGSDTRFSDEKVTASRNFANKIWNAARFVRMNLPEDRTLAPGLPETLELEDRWALSAYNTMAKEVTENLDKLELGLAAGKISDYFWDIYCDWYIEIAKLRLNGDDPEKADNARRVLVWLLRRCLRLLHPFMPFITEELYQALPQCEGSIMVSRWPAYDPALVYSDDEKAMGESIALIKAIRAVRTEMGVAPGRRTSLFIETEREEDFGRCAFFIQRFGFATAIEIGPRYTGPSDGTVQVATAAARAFIPMAELVDREKELARLQKEEAGCDKQIAQLSAQLSNQAFLSKAPAHVVEDMRAKLLAATQKKENIEKGIAALQ